MKATTKKGEHDDIHNRLPMDINHPRLFKSKITPPNYQLTEQPRLRLPQPP